jgi:hypothetical protein
METSGEGAVACANEVLGAVRRETSSVAVVSFPALCGIGPRWCDLSLYHGLFPATWREKAELTVRPYKTESLSRLHVTVG